MIAQDADKEQPGALFYLSEPYRSFDLPLFTWKNTVSSSPFRSKTFSKKKLLTLRDRASIFFQTLPTFHFSESFAFCESRAYHLKS